jgi:hypothetical protein
MSSRIKAYIAIGGPLDGQHLRSTDLHGDWVDGDHVEGLFEALREEYAMFNNAGTYRVEVPTSAVWIHTSLLQPSQPPGKRR